MVRWAVTRPLTWQLIIVWLAASVTLGTVALLFLPTARSRIPPSPVLPRQDLLGPVPVRSIRELSPLAGAAALGLLLGLFAVLLLLAWLTGDATWLAGGVRARVLWAALAGLAGLAGWFFAATVTFAAGFSTHTQLLLAYLAGGLPFALAAAMLQRPWPVNLAAAVAVAGLVIAGYLLVAKRAQYDPNVFRLSLRYLLFLISGPPLAAPLH